ncbi:DNA repair protein RecO [Piscinibacter sakaiensis]|uniref:DNA repair protein RecO n=1 Tax=Piscinibacter sakaiensis TaxID=1547922 RepID=UPI003AB1005B
MKRQPSTLAAFVLHQYDWSESSLIVDLLTREQGRIVVVAKGAKRPYSQLRSILLPFNRIQISLGRAQRDNEQNASEVQTLRAAEWAGGDAAPSGAALFSGFYLNELLIKLLARNDPHPGLFDAYAATLPALAGAGESRNLLRDAAAETPRAALRDDARGQAALRAFELKLLQETGLLPELSIVTSTQTPVAAAGHYRLSAEHGVMAADADGELSGLALIDVQAALQHGSLDALRQACARSLPGWRSALRGMLQYHLGSASLRTRQLMIELQSYER